MRATRLLTLFIASVLGLVLAASTYADEKNSRPADAASHPVLAQTVEASASSASPKDSRVKQKGDRKPEAPQYKPPRRGRAWRTIGGATRGSATCRPVIAVLAPHDHSGLTTREQPTLYWYLSDTCPSAVDFTLIEADGIAPLVETTLKPPGNAGLQTLDLSEHGVVLGVGKLYVWSIAFVPDRDHRSRDIMAEGGIRRVKPDAAVSAKLAAAPAEHTPSIYAEAGFWYDAISELSSLIRANPSNDELRQQRALLLEQVQLVNVAGHDVATAGSNPG